MTDKPKTEKPRTRAELEKELAAVSDELASYREVHRACKGELERAIKREQEVRTLFGDLKEKLAHSESEAQRMRGYISRVQEDDTVREELVRTGDPEGECQLVPKRKPTAFHATDGFMAPMTNGMSVGSYHDRERLPRKHWVNY